MIFVTLTKPKRKMQLVLSIAFVTVLLGVVVPFLHFALTAAGAMTQFVAKEDGIPGEPIRVTAPPQEGFVDNIWLENLLAVMSEPKEAKEESKE